MAAQAGLQEPQVLVLLPEQRPQVQAPLLLQVLVLHPPLGL